MKKTRTRLRAALLALTLLLTVSAPAFAAEEAAGLSYNITVETVDATGVPKSTFAVGETITARVVLTTSGTAAAAPLYAVQVILTYGNGLNFRAAEAAADLPGGQVTHLTTREVRYLFVNADGQSAGRSCTLFTATFTADTDGKPILSLSQPVVANSDATHRPTTATATTQITVGTGARPTDVTALMEMLSAEVVYARQVLNSGVLSDVEISAYYPTFRVTRNTYNQLQSAIQGAQAFLDQAGSTANPTKEQVTGELDYLESAVEMYNDNRIYRYQASAGTVNVSISASAGGTAAFGSGAITRVRTGTSLTVLATPDAGYEVCSIYVNGTRLPGAETYTISHVDWATEVYVEFSPILAFTDVAANAWYYDAVRYISNANLMNGVSDTAFAPDGTVTRGMLVTILHRMENTPAATGSSFPDVPAGQYYTEAVAWAAENNIVTGYSSERFGPLNPVTREQMAAIIYRYAAWKGNAMGGSADVSSFPDAGSISAYALSPLQWAFGNGIITGRANGSLDPAGRALRSELATILLRFLEN